jgi:CBS domain-containing protein
MTSAVRRMSGSPPQHAPPPPPGQGHSAQPTNIQLQALLDAHKPGHHAYSQSSPVDTTPRGHTSVGFNAPTPASPASRASTAKSLSPATSLGKLDLVVGRLSTAMQSKKHQMREKLAYMDKEQEARAQLLLKHTVDLVKENLLPINVDPFTVHSTSSVDQVYMLFNSVKINCVFVVEEDQVLQGMISQVNLMQRLKKKN